MAPRKVLVVGGGAAGLMAAGQAALAGAEVLVLEKMKRPGRKICISGKGRCNITNVADLRDFISHFGPSGRFLHQAFARFFTRELMEFFTDQGVPLVTERGGRVFPASGRAYDVLDALVRWAGKSGAGIIHSAQVERLILDQDRVAGVMVNGKPEIADAVILTTGGASYPRTGSTGDGYRMAEAAGHTIVPIRPALVPLETKGREAAAMAGLNLRNIRVRMYVNNKKKAQAFGELVFADHGLTGPVILTLSAGAVDALRSNKLVELAIDLKPALDEQKLDARLLRDLQARAKEEMRSVLRAFLPREMVPVILARAEIDPDLPATELSAGKRGVLRRLLKSFRFTITGHRPLAEAIITAGGVSTREVDPATMQSRKCQGLYLAGELLDLQADTGGYNLQAAFSTGWLAGRSTARSPA